MLESTYSKVLQMSHMPRRRLHSLLTLIPAANPLAPARAATPVGRSALAATGHDTACCSGKARESLWPCSDHISAEHHRTIKPGVNQCQQQCIGPRGFTFTLRLRHESQATRVTPVRFWGIGIGFSTKRGTIEALELTVRLGHIYHC